MTKQYNLTALIAASFLLPVMGCGENTNDSFQGYVEGEFLYLAAPQAGYLKTLDAPRGSRVTAGQTIFMVADDPDNQVLVEAESHAESTKQKLLNLKEPKRQTEIAALEANLHAAEAALRLSHIHLQQQEKLLPQHFVAQVTVDEARSARDQAAAQVDAIKKQIATSQNTVGRQAEIHSAESDLKAANAQIEQKRWALEHKTVKAPTMGEVTDTYYQRGEWVPAGASVASLLPDARRRLRFFVPETKVAGIKMGDIVEASCDGCSAPIRAHIDFISAQAEYTPPVIYSRGSREKLVFRVEAAPIAEQAGLIHPGLPIDVRLAP